jgi:hypothetical protein
MLPEGIENLKIYNLPPFSQNYFILPKDFALLRNGHMLMKSGRPNLKKRMPSQHCSPLPIPVD